MRFSHPFGDFAPFVFFGAIALGFLLGTGAPLWAYPLTFAVLLGLIFLAILIFEKRGTKEEREAQKQKDRCNELLKQAYDACLKRFLQICPTGIPVSEFDQRGYFGDYFARMIGAYTKGQ